MAYVFNGMLIINQKEQPTDTCNSMDETQKSQAARKYKERKSRQSELI